jgi:hypothetical protein
MGRGRKTPAKDWQAKPASTPMFTFTNIAPEDEEWSAHVRILNHWDTPEVLLRHIVGYIQAGPHYPKHMHQDLIEQYMDQLVEMAAGPKEEGIQGESYWKRELRYARMGTRESIIRKYKELREKLKL